MVSLRKATQTSVPQYPTQPEPSLKPQSTARPEAMPVYALCGHIGRRADRTCGSWNCQQMYGW